MTTPGNTSGFTHRDEFVYLPPAWFTSTPPPALPVVMMLGAELSSPSDWLQSGRALGILDDFAVQHRGTTPVAVFPDISGSFANDTECVNGPRGNAADHLVKEVVPFVISNFGVSPEPSSWGLAGWSSGGTCSLTLAVSHPELFSAVVDLDGQLGPNAGKKQQTIARLFAGDEKAWAAFDPKTIVEKHQYYYDMAAWVGVSDQIPTRYWRAGSGADELDTLRDWDTYSEDHTKTANQLCVLLSAHGAECSVVGYRGGHDFPSAANGFAAALPWLAGRLGTPGVPPIPLPRS
jgi:S-formylglutathione hydrolase FrmB